jgi:hypothetical protein
MLRLRIAASCLLVIFLSACGPKQSPKTRAYLLQLTQAVGQMDGDLAGQSLPKAPSMPAIPANASDDERVPKLRRYREELLKYLGALRTSIEQVSGVCDRTQSKIGGLDSAGVDSAAADLATKYQGLIDHRQQLGVQMVGLVAQQENEVRGYRISEAGIRLVASGTEALFSPSDSNPPAADDLQPKAGDQAQGGKEFAGVRRAISEWRADASLTTAARKDLLNSLKAQYPGGDWNFLGVKSAP